MKLAAMYPGFFPYLGHFDLANMADMYMIYDAGQYRRHKWLNRNRVLHPTSGWQYIIVPLRHHHFTSSILQVEITNEIEWKKTIFKQLDHYHMDAPYYGDVISLVRDCFSTSETDLVKLTTEIYRAVCGQLHITASIPVFSEMELGMTPPRGPENLALAICEAVGATEFINPPGGADLYHHEIFAQHGIQLTIQSFTNMTYSTGRFQFEPGLSIIDVMMWNSCEQIKNYLDTFRLVENAQSIPFDAVFAQPIRELNVVPSEASPL